MLFVNRYCLDEPACFPCTLLVAFHSSRDEVRAHKLLAFGVIERAIGAQR